MTLAPAVARAPQQQKDNVLGRLEQVTETRGLGGLTRRLGELRDWLDAELGDVEDALRSVGGATTPMYESGRHLLRQAGKRLRPTCVLLAARCGDGGGARAHALAVAVELVHNATLLHDDVIDLGELRRGAPAARVVYGNSASIYAGDWLLVEALQRVHSAGLDDVLVRALGTLKEMLDAESLQLKNRGKSVSSAADYFRVVEGKTASLFRWALYAGGRAGGVPITGCVALERYGERLGIAFQVIDDLLDVAGDARVLGKARFADLREGKMTYPLLLALSRDPSLGALVEAAAESGGAEPDDALVRRVGEALERASAAEECKALARKLSGEAVEALSDVPAGAARDALTAIAVTMVERSK